jgi:hypothetical protein
VIVIFNLLRLFSSISDNNPDAVIICRLLRWRKKKGNGKREHWVHSFFHDNLNSVAHIEVLDQDPGLFKSVYLKST